MEKLTKKQIKLKEATAAFNKLPKAEQRVLIAKDVLKQIKVGKYKPKVGSYTSLPGDLNISDKSVQENFNLIQNCEVCALGCCLLSITKFKNKLSFSELTDEYYNTKTRNLFSSIFSASQIALIEAAFEKRTTCIPWADKVNGEDAENKVKHIYKATWFGKQYEDSTERLKAIMKNIITNKGTFRP